MPINTEQLKDLTERTLKQVGWYSQAATELVMLTFAQESHCGTFLTQLGTGPAKGIGQMEPATHDDLWHNYLVYRSDAGRAILEVAGMVAPNPDALEWNLAYAILMTRAQYRRRPEPLPEANDIRGLAEYWKQWYNTPLGEGTVEEAMLNYKRFVLGGEE